MTTQLQLGDIAVQVLKKDIKNVHLSVLPPVGAVRVAAPRHMKLEAIRLFLITKLPWIKKQRQKFQAQVRESRREFVDRESHYVWGKRYLLKRVQSTATPQIEQKHTSLIIYGPGDMSSAKCEQVMAAWYRQQIRQALPGILEKWQAILGVPCNRVFVQSMKTKWGSSNPQSRHIRLNTELAKKPIACLEYVVVHELAHFLAPKHDANFTAILDGHLPHWRSIRQELNQAPLRDEQWDRAPAKPSPRGRLPGTRQ